MKGLFAALALCAAALATQARAEVVWYPLPQNAFHFGDLYPEAQRLLFAFDYGHALLYDRLLEQPKPLKEPEAFEQKTLGEIMAILHNPPHSKVDEGDIAPNYVFNFPLTTSLFDWSHLLHQFVYDELVSSDDRGPLMQARVEALIAKYKSERSIAISDVCKSMLFMDGHFFSKSFRRQLPSLNLLIWSYHWLQMHLYEDLMKATRPERDAAVAATLKRFWSLVSDLPDSADFDMMPETARIAPSFVRLWPQLGPAFDNNHMMHDIVSDILSSDKVTNPRAEGLRIGRMALDDEAFRSPNCGRDGVKP